MPQNRLIHERSPYLLQHANNPVDWYPWGEEAFARARAEQKPLFISVGYSTCHWCHVMEHESFESEAVAAFLNAHFIAVKVDREERPDVDAIYMAAVQAMSGNGGWPMSVFTTPELKPFFAGTYFPPEPRYGRPGFLQLLHRIHELWTNERDGITASGEELLTAVRSATEVRREAGEVSEALIANTYRYFEQAFDPAEGGFGGAPKFPRPVQFDLLFHVHRTTGNVRARDMALFTLRKMALGGMHDHLGGGFHRYSVDRYWRVSHFEKMLYDQALLLASYLDAWQISGEPLFAETARDIIEYVSRDMTHPSGAFYSAEDADSEGKEGKFYAWTRPEITTALGDDAPAFCAHFSVTDEGNFEEGLNVLHAREELTNSPDAEAIARSMAKLFALRSARARPHLDDKILTSWNGLMIGALARAGVALADPRYTALAVRAAEFIWRELRTNGTLLHRWCEGEARFDAYLDDYAFLTRGFLELYEATFDAQWLDRAIALQQELDGVLFDTSDGAYFLSRESSDILVRVKSDHDGAEPAGNSVVAQNLFRLAELTARESYRTKAERIVRYAAGRVGDYPYSMPEMMAAAHWMLYPPETLVLVGEDVTALQQAAAQHYRPLMVRIHAAHTPAPFARTLSTIDGTATAYLCHDLQCDRPVTSAEALAGLLSKV